MNRGVLIIAFFLLIGIGIYFHLKPQGIAVSSDGSVSFEVDIRNRAMQPSIIRVVQGAQIELRVRSDEGGIMYVNGYDSTSLIAKGEMTNIRIHATTPGLHGIYMHPESSPQQNVKIGDFEVSVSNAR